MYKEQKEKSIGGKEEMIRVGERVGRWLFLRNLQTVCVLH